MLRVPPPAASVQVNAGSRARFAPNWSCAVALNCLVAFGIDAGRRGDSVMAETVWLTTTVTLELFDRPARLVTVAWNV